MEYYTVIKTKNAQKRFCNTLLMKTVIKPFIESHSTSIKQYTHSLIESVKQFIYHTRK
jgi:hypothetical protein